MGKRKITKYLDECAVILTELFGCFVIAVGFNNVAIAAKIPMAGFSGIAYLINLFTGLPIGWIIIILNIPVATICYKLLGRQFFLRSLRCMILSSLMIDYVAPMLPVYSGDRMLAALMAGTLLGIGYAMIYARGSSSGGVDFIIMAIKALRPHLQVGYICFAMDIMVIAVLSVVFKDLDAAIYGIIVSFLMSAVIDKIIAGANMGKMVFVVTEHGVDIADVIDRSIQRGSTIIDGSGGYKQSDKQIVLCACSTKQLFQLQQAIKEKDPDSFLIVVQSNEVHGNGFKMLQLGRKAPDKGKRTAGKNII